MTGPRATAIRCAGLLLLLVAPLTFFGPAFLRNGILEGENDMAWFLAHAHLKSSLILEGRFPIWTPWEALGLPLAALPHMSLWYPPNAVFLLLDLGRAAAAHLALHLLLGAGAAYLLAREVGAGRAGAFLAAAAASGGGLYVNLRFSGHVDTFTSIPFFHLGIAAALRSWRTGRLRWDVLTAWAFAALLVQMRLEVILMGVYLTAAVVAFHPVPSGAARGRGAQCIRLVGAGALGAAVAAVQLFPLIELARLSIRGDVAGAGFAARYAMPPQQLAGLIVPNLFGSAADGTYWGASPFSEQWIYAGVVPCLVAAAGLRASASARFWIVVGATGALLMIGPVTPVFEGVVRALPFLSWLRNPTRYALLLFTALWILLALGFDRLHDDAALRRRTSRGALLLAAAGLAGAGILAFAPVASLPARYFSLGAVHAFRPAIAGLLRCALAAALAAGILRLESRRPGALAAGLAVLVVADLASIGAPLHRVRSFETYFGERPVAAALRGLLRPGERYLRLSGGEWYLQDYPLRRLPSVSAYGPSIPRRFFELVAAANGEAHPAPAWDLDGVVPRRLSSPLFPLFGARYVLSGETVAGTAPVYRDRGSVVSILPDTLPFAFSLPLSAVRPAASEADAVRILSEPSFDPRSEAVAEMSAAGRGETASVTAASWTRVSPSRIDALVEADDAFLVVLEGHHPGWTAAVDGAAADVVPANLALLGVPLPGPGPHRVRLVFRPVSLLLGAAVSAAGVLLSLLALVRGGGEGRG